MGSKKARAEYDELEQYRITPYWRQRTFYRTRFAMGTLSRGIFYGIPIAVIIHSFDRYSLA